MKLLNILTDEQKADIYLDWFNNYYYMETFLTDYEIDHDTAAQILAQGYIAQENRAKRAAK